jgi:hypothetical protein
MIKINVTQVLDSVVSELALPFKPGSSETCGKLHIHKHLLDNFYIQLGPKKV